MKKTLWAAVLAAACGVAGHAAAEPTSPARDLGVGIAVGEPMGITAKWWMNETLAFDGGIGYGNAAVFHAGVVYNNWRLLPAARHGRNNLYFAVGPRIATDDGGQFAIRAMGGAAYWTPNHPIELFAEVGPTFKITPDNRVGLDGAVGLRYYFHVSLSPVK